jgi:hypothetical protein
MRKMMIRKVMSEKMGKKRKMREKRRRPAGTAYRVLPSSPQLRQSGGHAAIARINLYVQSGSYTMFHVKHISILQTRKDAYLIETSFSTSSE